MSERDHPDDGQRGVVLLMRTWNDTEAEMVRQILAGHGIPCQVVSDVPHTVWPIAVDGLGEVRILVKASREAEARNLIADHRRRGFEILDGQRGSADDPAGPPDTADPASRAEGEES